MGKSIRFTFVPNAEISDYQWNNCVQQSINCDIHNYAWFLDVIDSNWYGIIADDYRAVMPVFIKKVLGRNVAYIPDMSGANGIFSKEPLSQELINGFIEVLEKRTRSFSYHFNKYIQLGETKHKIVRKPWYELDLISSYKKMLKDYSQEAQETIEYCRENPYTVVQGISLRRFTSFISDNIPKLGFKHMATLQLLVSNSVRYRNGQTIGLYDEVNNLCGVSFVIWANNKVALKTMGLTKQARKDGAAYYLLDHYIKENAGKNTMISIDPKFFFDDPDKLSNMGLQKTFTTILQKKGLFW